MAVHGATVMCMGQERTGFQIDLALGARVRKARTGAGLSQQSMGQKLGISFQQVERYERGEDRISPERLCAIARVLNLPVADLLAGASQAGAYGMADDKHILHLFQGIEDRQLQRYVIDLLRVMMQARSN